MNKYADIFLNKYNIDPNIILKKPIRGMSGITAKELILALISTDNIQEAATLLGYSENPVRQATKNLLFPLFPDRSREFGSGSTSTWRFTLLLSIGYKKCYYCSSYLELEQFVKSSSKSSGFQSICLGCNTAKSKQEKAEKLKRTPSWANLDIIRDIYKYCPEDCHVDHIVPLQGKLVCGLHVESNLQYLSAKDNLAKGNRYSE